MNTAMDFASRKTRIYASLAAATILSCIAVAPAHAAGTPAGTNIVNTANASYDNPADPANPFTVDSNQVTMIVDELLDVTTVSKDAGPIIVNPGQTGRVTTFEVTNTGNGPEAFNLTATGVVAGDQFDPTNVQIFLDTNGDGDYDPGIDLPATATPLLPIDGKVTVFVVATIPAGATDGQEGKVELTATAVTGSGDPGTTFAGKGEGGGDAVVGSTRAQATDDGTYKISAATVTLVKSQSVVDPFGGANTVPGSIITYTIVANVSGSGTVNGLRISDVVPAGTTYVPASIIYESAAQTDAVDGDVGSITGTTVLGTVPSIALGSTPTSTTRTLSFRVRVNTN